MTLIKKLSAYTRLKEMRPVWFFVFLALGEIAAGWWGLPSVLAYILTLANTVFLIMLVASSISLAKANFAVKLEKSQNAAIIAGFSEGIVAYDQNFRVWSMNQSAEVIAGVRKEEVLGQVVTPEWASNPRFRLLTQVLFPSLAPVVTRKSVAAYPQVVEVSFTEPRTLHLEITTNQIFDENGKLIGFLKVVRDRSREVELLRMKTEFITVAAHQFRTPLSGIRWASETLLSGTFGALPDDSKDAMNQIHHTTEKLIRLVDELLDLAKIEEGKFGYEFEKSDLLTLIQEILEQVEPAAKERDVRLIFYRPEEEVPLLVMDPRRIRLVVQNLVENAIKYNIKNGEVRIKVEKLKDKSYVEVSVADTGVGIAEQDLARIFTKFFRGENVMRIETEGSGLGLFISRNIVKRHGGDIWVKSVEKRGTTFFFTLPTDESLIPPVEITAHEVF